MNSQSSTKYEINTVSSTNICVRNDYIDFFSEDIEELVTKIYDYNVIERPSNTSQKHIFNECKEASGSRSLK